MALTRPRSTYRFALVPGRSVPFARRLSQLRLTMVLLNAAAMGSVAALGFGGSLRRRALLQQAFLVIVGPVNLEIARAISLDGSAVCHSLRSRVIRSRLQSPHLLVGRPSIFVVPSVRCTVIFMARP